MRKSHLISAFILALFLASGCATKSDTAVETGYKIIQTAAIVYDAAMSSARDLWDEGFLTNEQIREVRDVAVVYYDAYRAAVDALYAYKDVTDAEGYQKIVAACTNLGKSMGSLLTVLGDFGVPVANIVDQIFGSTVQEYLERFNQFAITDDAEATATTEAEAEAA